MHCRDKDHVIQAPRSRQSLPVLRGLPRTTRPPPDSDAARILEDSLAVDAGADLDAPPASETHRVLIAGATHNSAR